MTLSIGRKKISLKWCSLHEFWKIPRNVNKLYDWMEFQ